MNAREQQVERTFDRIGGVNSGQLVMHDMLGRLVVPDLVNGVSPGTPWIPSRGTMSRPAFPKMPDEHTTEVWRKAYERRDT